MGSTKRHADAEGAAETNPKKRKSGAAAEDTNVSKKKRAESVDVTSEEAQLTYEERAALAIPIAHPMASKKLGKKIFKLLKKAQEKKKVKAGLKDFQTAMRKKMKGIAVFGGSVNPLDVISHLPIVCEDEGVPYVFVPTAKDIGSAMNFHRSSVCALIDSDPDYQELYDEVLKEVRHLPPPPGLDNI